MSMDQFCISKASFLQKVDVSNFMTCYMFLNGYIYLGKGNHFQSIAFTRFTNCIPIKTDKKITFLMPPYHVAHNILIDTYHSDGLFLQNTQTDE